MNNFLLVSLKLLPKHLSLQSFSKIHLIITYFDGIQIEGGQNFLQVWVFQTLDHFRHLEEIKLWIISGILTCVSDPGEKIISFWIRISFNKTDPDPTPALTITDQKSEKNNILQKFDYIFTLNTSKNVIKKFHSFELIFFMLML